MQWYYLSDSHERIAMSEAQFPALAARGLLRPTTPVWRKGLPGWTACSEVKPEIFAGGITRDSDQRSSISDNAAVQGTIIGLARVLAGFRVWIWILGGIVLLFALADVGLLGWETWIMVKYGVEALNRGYAFIDQVKDFGWILWLLMAFQAVIALVTGWAGWCLVRGGIRAVQARESGNEQYLTDAIRDIGRYFVISVLMTLVSVVLWVGLGLWLGWDRVFAVPGPPSAQKVSV